MKNEYHLRHKNPEQWAWYCPRLSQIISNSVNLFCLHCVLFSHCTLFWREKNCCWCQGILRYGTSPYFVIYILDIKATVNWQHNGTSNFHFILSTFLPCIPLNGLGASSSGYFLNFGVGLIVLVTIFSWFTCLSVPIHGAFPYISSSRNQNGVYIWHILRTSHRQF